MTEHINTNAELAQSEPTELSIADLDQVSGGLDLVISGSFFEQDSLSLTQSTYGSGCGVTSASSLTQSSTRAGSFQIAGFGFESMNEIFALFAGLSRLFGR